MILKDFIAKLQNMVIENPEYATLQVIAAKDDEGNGYNPIYFDPSPGQYEDREFVTLEEFAEYEEEFDADYAVNAICVN